LQHLFQPYIDPFKEEVSNYEPNKQCFSPFFCISPLPVDQGQNPLSKAAFSRQKVLSCSKTLRTCRLLCAIFTWAPPLYCWKRARGGKQQWGSVASEQMLHGGFGERERTAPGSLQPSDALERIISSGILHYA